MADYANLSRNILQEIIKYLSFPDYIRFGAVCSHWFNVSNEGYHSPQKQLPWLVCFDIDFPKFFNPSEEKVYQIEMPELHGRYCAGSSHGWLITIDLDLNINLVNPFSKAQIDLPLLPFDTFGVRYQKLCEISWLNYPKQKRDKLIYKAVLSADPSKSSDYIVIAIYFANSKLAFWRPSDLTWIVINTHSFVEDIVWCNGAFYVVDSSNHVCLVDLGINNKLIKINSLDNGYLKTVEKYIVDFMGELLLVYKSTNPIKDHYNDDNNDADEDEDDLNYHENEFDHTIYFKLFKLDQKENKFIKIKNINGYVLFLGSNHAMMIPTATVADKTKNNIIYFTDYIYANYMFGYSESGIYNIRERSITPFPWYNITPLPFHNIYHQAKRITFIDVNP
ncbi:F-box domain-containing protein [Dioscorea alata]|uniref:F-box domain-containing protein n=1 Tax=Dioscorea alata TaxID=55571 RepID=A0ACB7UEG5_DIOAL|nr:F-box domain-containing protein [Dioscorea alata]